MLWGGFLGLSDECGEVWDSFGLGWVAGYRVGRGMLACFGGEKGGGEVWEEGG